MFFGRKKKELGEVGHHFTSRLTDKQGGDEEGRTLF